MDKIALQVLIDSSNPEILYKANKNCIDKYSSIMPLSLIELWNNYGFGFYCNGLIQLINPDEYISNLWSWLNQKENYNRIPIAISSFGIIIYYRKLTETDYDIAFINPHNSTTGILSWNIEEFFNIKLFEDNIQKDLLDIEMVTDVKNKLGPLLKNEMYCYIPALRLGGDKSPKNVDKCDAQIHLDFLLQLALG